MRKRLINCSLIAAGGGVGSLLRYIVSFAHSYEPYPTIFVNLVGSLFLGFITSLFQLRREHEWLKLLLGTGFCGGFTTMSTFSFQLTELPLEEAIVYMSCSVLFSMVLVILGMRIAVKFRKVNDHL